MINELNNSKKYDALEQSNNKASQLIEKLNKSYKKDTIKDIKNKLIEKFQAQQKNLSLSEIREYLKILDNALELLEKYEKNLITIDLESLKRIEFVNKIEDLKHIKQASESKKKKEIEDEDYELMFDIVRKSSSRK